MFSGTFGGSPALIEYFDELAPCLIVTIEHLMEGWKGGKKGGREGGREGGTIHHGRHGIAAEA